MPSTSGRVHVLSLQFGEGAGPRVRVELEKRGCCGKVGFVGRLQEEQVCYEDRLFPCHPVAGHVRVVAPEPLQGGVRKGELWRASGVVPHDRVELVASLLCCCPVEEHVGEESIQ
eukprot:14232015-Heterocapsa_arctica.AAC.1